MATLAARRAWPLGLALALAGGLAGPIGVPWIAAHAAAGARRRRSVARERRVQRGGAARAEERARTRLGVSLRADRTRRRGAGRARALELARAPAGSDSSCGCGASAPSARTSTPSSRSSRAGTPGSPTFRCPLPGRWRWSRAPATPTPGSSGASRSRCRRERRARRDGPLARRACAARAARCASSASCGRAGRARRVGEFRDAARARPLRRRRDRRRARSSARVEALGYRASRYDPAALERRRTARGAHRARAAARRRVPRRQRDGVSFALYFGALAGIEPERAPRRCAGWRRVSRFQRLTWCALPFWRGAWAGLRRRELTLDVPIVLGVSTAFAASVARHARRGARLFMDSASMIVFLMLLGRTLERSARARASAAVDRLAARAPRSALRRGPSGARGGRRRARSWPATGSSCPPAGVPDRRPAPLARRRVDQSLLTGESLPVALRAGDAVRSGTTNLSGDVDVEVTAAAATGTLRGWWACSSAREAERPRVQRSVDRRRRRCSRPRCSAWPR